VAPVSKVPRVDRREELLVAGTALSTLAVVGVLPPGTLLPVRVAAGLVAWTLAGWAWRQRIESAALAVLLAALTVLAGLGVLWQIAMPLSIGTLWLVSRVDARLRVGKLQGGTIPALPTLICSGVTPVALVLWVRWAEPDLSALGGAVPEVHPALLAVGAGVFSIVNATFEEWIWRGYIQERLTQLLGAPWGIVLQAASFGLIHAWGFPSGIVGVAIVGVWAVALGVLRQRAGGLRAVIVAHVVADASIAAIVLLWWR
jgi:membrane protease YdiL (CAAX protease family)